MKADKNELSEFYLGLKYNDEGDYDKAIEHYMKAVNAGDANAAFNLGLIYDNNKDYDNAIKYYTTALTLGGGRQQLSKRYFVEFRFSIS